MLRIILLGLSSVLLLSACQDPCADLKRQLYLVQQNQQSYAVSQRAQEKNKPSEYTFCGDEQTPCPGATDISIATKEKQSNETTH